jgi:hypothetical protein
LVKRIFIFGSYNLVEIIGGGPSRWDLFIFFKDSNVFISRLEKMVDRREAESTSSDDQNGLRLGDAHCSVYVGVLQ